MSATRALSRLVLKKAGRVRHALRKTAPLKAGALKRPGIFLRKLRTRLRVGKRSFGKSERRFIDQFDKSAKKVSKLKQQFNSNARIRLSNNAGKRLSLIRRGAFRRKTGLVTGAFLGNEAFESRASIRGFVKRRRKASNKRRK